MKIRIPRLPKIKREHFRQFFKIALPFFRSESSLKARGLLSVLVLLLFGVAGVNILMSYAGRDFMTALSGKKEYEFYSNLFLYLGTFILATPIAVFYRYTEERLALLWRQWLTQHLIRRYFYKRNYYHLRGLANVDNPDQRIAEDVKNFTATSLSFLLITLNSLITLVALTGVLFSISTKLVVVLCAYSLGGTLFSILIGRRLVKLYFRQFKREAGLRYGLIRVRDNAESIAFYRGEPRELIDLYRKVGSALRNTALIIGWNRNLAFFTTGYNYIALVLPTLIVAPLYLKGQVEFGVIPQAAGAFSQVLAALSLIIVQFERLSAFTAGVTRLSELWDVLQAGETSEEEDPQLAIEEQQYLSLQKVSVLTPYAKEKLITDLSLTLRKGEGVLIMGESGSGKSSLLRTIAGLWTSGEGTIRRPQLKEMVFLPQKPYMISGTLRAQLMYPRRERMAHDRELREILTAVNLTSLLERVSNNLDKELDWANVLSLGEQQRLSFGRLLFLQPQLCFLDEATSALDEENEMLLYSLLRTLNCSFVSVGHRQSLKNFHDKLLFIEKKGQWRLEELPREQKMRTKAYQ